MFAEILIRNFMRELEQDGQQRSLASNQIVSRILDSALPHADITQVLAMSSVFAEDLRPLCVDPYASHNIQTLLTLSLKYAQVGYTLFLTCISKHIICDIPSKYAELMFINLYIFLLISRNVQYKNVMKKLKKRKRKFQFLFLRNRGKSSLLSL